MSNKLKITSLVIAFSILAIVASLILVQTGFAQADPEDVERFVNELRKSGDTLKERYEMQLENVELKQAFVEILQERQEAEQNGRESKDKERRLSLFTFELFNVRSRLIIEELKLWQIESMIELQSVQDSDKETEAINRYFEELVDRREQATKDIVELSEKLGQYITEPNIKNQFDQLLYDSLYESSE